MNYAYATVYAQAFDAIWTIAQVLNYTEEMTINQINRSSVHENCRDLPGELVPLDEFNYSNAFMGCVIKYNFYKVNFTGVTVSSCWKYFFHMNYQSSYNMLTCLNPMLATKLIYIVDLHRDLFCMMKMVILFTPRSE